MIKLGNIVGWGYISRITKMNIEFIPPGGVMYKYRIKKSEFPISMSQYTDIFEEDEA